MGQRGARHPQGLTQNTLRTLFLRAPYSEWSALAQGVKEEFRTLPTGIISIQVPTPVVLYATSPTLKKSVHRLMVLTDHQTGVLEDLAHDPEARARENCATYDDFRRYWRRRTRRPFRALEHVEVFRLARWEATNAAELGEHLLERLYGEYIR